MDFHRHAAAQVKLLRVIQEHEFERVGGHQPIRVDVRLIAATNRNLADDVEQGRFRADLYYRLNVAAINLLPLRERPGDILPLAWHFIERYSKRLKLTHIELTADADRALLDYGWPGNIRELENVIHHALLICKNSKISQADLHLNAGFRVSRHVNPANNTGFTVNALETALTELYQQPNSPLFEKIEETIIRTAYQFCENNQVQTGRLLGISRNILRHRLKRYGFLA